LDNFLITSRPKQLILIIDDSRENLALLRELLEEEDYTVVTAADGEEGMELIRRYFPDLVLLDVVMPSITGYEVCRTLKNDPLYQFIPVILITSLDSLDDKVRGLESGADDFIHKPFNRVELLARVKSLLRIKSLIDRLERTESILFTLANIIEAKDNYTEEHTKRVGRYAVEIAKEMRLDDEYYEIMKKGGMLHDVGKIGIPERILLKRSSLTDKEFEVMKTHTTIGEKICAPLKSIGKVIPIIKYHHERIDGTGYPDGLEGNSIPIEAKIISVCDAYDAMITDRPYRKRLASEEALEIINGGAGTQWDTEIVRVFTLLVKKKRLEGFI